MVSESLATLQYLEEAYPEPSLVPKAASPQVSQAMLFQLTTLLKFSPQVIICISTECTAHKSHAYLLLAALHV